MLKKILNFIQKFLIEPFRDKEWISVILNSLITIATFCTIVLTYSSLKEIKTQRIKTFEPELRISNAPFRMICKVRNRFEDSLTLYFILLTYNTNFDSSLLLYPEDIRTHKKIDDWQTYGRANLFSVPVYNVGHGVALDVNVKFEIDTNYFLNLINKYSEILGGIDSVFISEGNFVLTYMNDTTNLYDEYNKTEHFQFMPEMSISKDTSKIFFPSTYFNLMTYRQLLLVNYFPNGRDYGINYPELDSQSIFDTKDYPLIVSLEYKDINDQFYVRKFKCHYEMEGIHLVPYDRTDIKGKMVVEYIPGEKSMKLWKKIKIMIDRLP